MDNREIRAKALEIAMLSFSVPNNGMFERLKEDGSSEIPKLIEQRSLAIEKFILQARPESQSRSPK
jgi:hypothetical protein